MQIVNRMTFEDKVDRVVEIIITAVCAWSIAVHYGPIATATAIFLLVRTLRTSIVRMMPNKPCPVCAAKVR